MLLLVTTAPAVFASLSTEAPEDAVAHIETIVERHNKQKPVINDLEAALKNENTNIRVKERAAWALGELEVRSAVPSLIQACGHKGLLVRSAALNALIRIRPVEALPTLVNIADSDPILSLRQDATIALGLLQSEKAIKPLVKLSSDPTPEVRGASALAMGALQSKKNDFTSLLKEIQTTDASPYVAERAKNAMAIATRKNATVMEQLESPDADIRLFAALYLTSHGTSKELLTIKKAANNDADEETRHQLEKAAIAIKKRSATTPTAKKKATNSPKKAH